MIGIRLQKQDYVTFPLPVLTDGSPFPLAGLADFLYSDEGKQ